MTPEWVHVWPKGHDLQDLCRASYSIAAYLGLVVSEKIFLCFSYSNSMGANVPQDGTISEPWGMISRT